MSEQISAYGYIMFLLKRQRQISGLFSNFEHYKYQKVMTYRVTIYCIRAHIRHQSMMRK